MKKWTIIHIHNTPMFYVETQIGRKPQNAFSYMSWRITFIGSTNFLCFLAATERRLQPPSFSGYNLREAPTPQISGYNQKETKTNYLMKWYETITKNTTVIIENKIMKFLKFSCCSHKFLLYLTFTCWGTAGALPWSPWRDVSGDFIPQSLLDYWEGGWISNNVIIILFLQMLYQCRIIIQ